MRSKQIAWIMSWITWTCESKLPPSTEPQPYTLQRASSKQRATDDKVNLEHVASATDYFCRQGAEKLCLYFQISTLTISSSERTTIWSLCQVTAPSCPRDLLGTVQFQATASLSLAAQDSWAGISCRSWVRPTRLRVESLVLAELGFRRETGHAGHCPIP